MSEFGPAKPLLKSMRVFADKEFDSLTFHTTVGGGQSSWRFVPRPQLGVEAKVGS